MQWNRTRYALVGMIQRYEIYRKISRIRMKRCSANENCCNDQCFIYKVISIGAQIRTHFRGRLLLTLKKIWNRTVQVFLNCCWLNKCGAEHVLKFAGIGPNVQFFSTLECHRSQCNHNFIKFCDRSNLDVKKI